jgi:N-acyl-D-aspartate/D-glutamate deacylase
MGTPYDVVIKGGSVYDGSGAEPTNADIGIRDGEIVEVGTIAGGKQVIDADGAIVTPAWVDIHTHYDGQVTWDDEMDPSASHGVGTIVMGNCGVGFAPVPPGGEQDLIDLMEGVEDIPGTALYEGMPWGAWESYPEYLDYLDSRNYALNISSMIAHGSVRNYVMGERGRNNEAATEADLTHMGRIVEEALTAGAVGFSTSRILGHRSIQGLPVPGTFANDAEVMNIAQALKRANKGLFQIIPSSTLGPGQEGFAEHASLEQEIDLIAAVSRESGRPATFTLFEIEDWSNKWREAIDRVKQANQSGAQVFPQVGSRPTGLVFSLETYHPWILKPTFKRLAELPAHQRLEQMRRPDIKTALLNEENDLAGIPVGSGKFLIANAPLRFEQTFPLTSSSTYEPSREESFDALAKASGGDGMSAMYDYLVAAPGRMSIMFFTNYADFNLDAVREMQMDESTVTGLSDAGAHVSMIFDAVNPTYQLTYWSRDRGEGRTLPLSHVIHRATQRNARLFGFSDRGLITPGMKADINVIDMAQLQLGDLTMRHDLPGGGARLMQGAKGYVATLNHGVLTRQMDQDTGARPGRLLRSS